VLASTARSEPAVEHVVASVRSELDGTGNSLSPIDVGFGWYTNGPGAMSETERASFYWQVASHLARSDCRISGLLARAWVTPQRNPSNPWEWYGMVDPESFKLTQTALSYRAVARTYLGYGSSPPPSSTFQICHPG